MQVSGLVLQEGSHITNAVLPTGSAFPVSPDLGELFYKTSDNAGLYIYANSGWRLITVDGINTVGWRDIVSDITVKGTKSTDPVWSSFINGLYAYKFSASALNEIWTTFHINHDYKPGSAIYLHTHWASNVATPNTGVVRWGFEYTIAKGHQQQAFPATSTVYVEQSQSSTPNMHHVAEIPAGINSSNLEPDTLILCRIFRDGAHANDTCLDPVFLLTADAHYLCDRSATLNKAPNFYA